MKEGQFANIVIKSEEEGQNLNSVLEEDGTVGSHVHAHTQLRETVSFRHEARDERQESLVYDDDQEQKRGR
jgi:hypothetical protein